MEAAKYAAAHLDLLLQVHNRACRAAVAQQQAEAELLDQPDLAQRCVTDRQVAVLLDRADRFVAAPLRGRGTPPATEVDLQVQEELRTLAHAVGIRLPMDVLADRHGLDELDRQALVAVAAPELDRAYERIYAYISDEFDRRYPTVEVLLHLTEGICDRHIQRVALGPLGRLRRRRLLLPYGDAPTDLGQPLRLAPGLLELLLGAPIDPCAVGGDPAETIADELDPPISCRPYDLVRLAEALSADLIDTVAVWCRRREIADAAVACLAASVGRPLRRAPSLAGLDPERAEAALRQAIVVAGVLGAVLWLPLDGDGDGLDVATAVLATTRHPVAVTSGTPWRPPQVLATRRWVEVEAVEDGPEQREARWYAHCPDADAVRLGQLAARFRLSPVTTAAAAGLARTATVLGADGPDVLEQACATVSAPRPDRLVTVVPAERGPDALVLAPALHQRVLEIAAFARVLPLLADRWGGNLLVRSQGGYKALFTGDPGTGKTLAAEVIAASLGVPLVKVDLSRVVSKWVGETAKHLDEVFELTSGASGVLFFDEADALFGKRGEVRHGTDRYANTEVSHLLQRFEDHPGLVILASNLRDNIDPAFSRRFQAVLHFPRPGEEERRRLWELALGPVEDLDGPIDLDALSSLDLTGAGIVASARAARLLAATSGVARMSMAHLVEGVAHQYRSEGRLFPVSELGSYLDGTEDQR